MARGTWDLISWEIFNCALLSFNAKLPHGQVDWEPCVIPRELFGRVLWTADVEKKCNSGKRDLRSCLIFFLRLLFLFAISLSKKGLSLGGSFFPENVTHKRAFSRRDTNCSGTRSLGSLPIDPTSRTSQFQPRLRQVANHHLQTLSDEFWQPTEATFCFLDSFVADITL